MKKRETELDILLLLDAVANTWQVCPGGSLY